ALDIHGDQATQLNVTPFFDAGGMLILSPLPRPVCLLFQRFHLPTPWVLGPLLVTAMLTASGTIFTYLPTEVTNIGQLLIGWALGDKFGPDFFRRAPRYLSVVALANALNIMLAFAFGYVLYLLSGTPFPTLVLGAGPGGIAEVAVPDKVRMLGGPVVASFHVLRMVFVLVVTAPLYKVLERRTRRA